MAARAGRPTGEGAGAGDNEGIDVEGAAGFLGFGLGRSPVGVQICPHWTPDVCNDP